VAPAASSQEAPSASPPVAPAAASFQAALSASPKATPVATPPVAPAAASSQAAPFASPEAISAASVASSAGQSKNAPLNGTSYEYLFPDPKSSFPGTGGTTIDAAALQQSRDNEKRNARIRLHNLLELAKQMRCASAQRTFGAIPDIMSQARRVLDQTNNSLTAPKRGSVRSNSTLPEALILFSC
jgi:hypothetical protein